jgi:hypothetical protein
VGGVDVPEGARADRYLHYPASEAVAGETESVFYTPPPGMSVDDVTAWFRARVPIGGVLLGRFQWCSEQPGIKPDGVSWFWGDGARLVSVAIERSFIEVQSDESGPCG